VVGRARGVTDAVDRTITFLRHQLGVQQTDGSNIKGDNA